MSQTIINQYLDKQALVSAIETFSMKHDMHQLDLKEGIYRDLLPQKSPGVGQQYAFEVDMDKCTGCKACVTACHNENGLDEDETWRSVGLIQGGGNGNAALQHITTACHHCAEPACMHGCPTKAYVKDPHTGIVKHLEDQCFGCQYCILKCPYDVPKYNKKKGIVHKCDMCVNRLLVGQAPACARACPNGAIRITVVNKKEVMERSKEFVNIPDAPASDYTYPTTRYKTKKQFPANMVSMDYHHIEPEHSHLPLVFMLVLTQLSVGAFVASFIVQRYVSGFLSQSLYPFHVLCALFLGVFALGASLLHLGRPQYFYRAILGIKTSWLSREILAFALFAHLALFYAGCLLIPAMGSFFTLILGHSFYSFIRIVILLSGMLGVYCSVKVYQDTRRPFWDSHMTPIKFFLTTFILGTAIVFLISIIHAAFNPKITMLNIMEAFGSRGVTIILILTTIKLLFEASVFFHLTQNDMSFTKKTAILMTRQLKKSTYLRFSFGVLGGVLLPVLLLNINTGVNPAWILSLSVAMLLFVLGGELLERYLFFRAVVPLKMPGG